MPDPNPQVEFDSLKKRAVAAMQSLFPVVGRQNRLDLSDVTVEEDAATTDSPHHVDNLSEQLRVKLRGGTWSVPVKARFTLTRISDNVVLDRSNPMIVGRIPKITPRYSYIVNGHERQHDSVFRSKSRPYHLVANNGETVARWNVAQGTGFDLIIDPASGRLQMKYRTSHVPLYPILRVLGVSEEEMRKRWGDKVFSANVASGARTYYADLAKFHRTATKGERGKYVPPPNAELEAAVRDILQGTKLRPDGMLAALGKEFSHVSGEALMLSADRIIGISKNEHEQDDRQALSAKDFTSTDDFVAEHILRDGKELVRKIKANLDRREKIAEMVSPGLFTKAINTAFDNGQRPEQTNPLTYWSGYTRTTIRGAAFGGVKGDQTNLDKDKLINPTSLGFLDPVQTPEGEDTGIALHLTMGVRREGKELKIQVYDRTTKGMRWVTPGEIEHENVAYPDQVRWEKEHPLPVHPDATTCYAADRRTATVPWSKVRYVLRSAKDLFGLSANRIPYLPCDQGNRAQFGAKQQEQAIGLLHREAPLVQAKAEGTHTYDEIIGRMASHRSPIDGTVTKIEAGKILVTPSGGGKPVTVHIYDHYPLNGGKTMLHEEPVVKVGQRVRKDELLADSNYTRGGVYADGINARVAYTPFHGLNFEDGIVVSESFATKATSEHLHVAEALIVPGMVMDTARWQDYVLPERATPERLAKLGKDGVIREGQKVSHGDVLIALLGPTGQSADNDAMAALSRKMARPFKDRGVYWDHDYPGVVQRVVRTQDHVTVYVKTQEKLSVGDKLSGRHGNKGIVSRVLPDKEMPHDKDGKPVEMLLNPAGVPSRMNVGQILETMQGKLAKHTGAKVVHVDNFTPGEDYTARVMADLKKAGLNPEGTEELFDPKTGASIGHVMTGYQHMLKLHHVVDKKMTARSFGGGYNPHGAPPSGSGVPGGGQKLDQLTTYALLAHGAVHNLREAYSYKSDADQEDVWVAIQSGQPLPVPKTARVVGHFLDYLKGMGVSAENIGSKYHFSPLTDAQVKHMSNGALRFSDRMLAARGDRTLAEAGGLFDQHVTGGIGGKFWSHIELQKRIPNPTFERPICRLLGINEKEFADLTGPALVNGKSGFDVINERLSAIDVKKELAASEELLKKTPMGTRLDQLYQKVRYLRALQRLKITPVEAYTNKLLPVLPPAVRPISVGLDGSQIVHDLNGIYRAVGQINQQIKTADPATPPAALHQLHASLYDAVKGLRATGMDMGEGVLRRHHNGLMEMLVGQGGPKTSFFHQAVMGRRQNLSGRSTIIPSPELSLDEVGLPQPMALEMFRPFVVEHMVKTLGYSPNQASVMVKKQEEPAIQALHEVVKHRPVLLKRDPALHKFSILAFKPVVVPGKAVGLHPLSCGGFNADFDGDTMALYVPVSKEAVAEAHKLLPSANLFSPTHGGLLPKPGQDGLVGLYTLSDWGKAAPGTPKTLQEQLQWLKEGKIHPSALVAGPGGRTTTIGRMALHEALPAGMKPHEKLLFDQTFRLDKKGLDAMLTEVGKKFPQEYAHTVDIWKDMGNKHAYLQAASFKLSDFADGKQQRDKILAPYIAEDARIRKLPLDQKEKDKLLLTLWFKAGEELKQKLGAEYKETKKNWLYNGWIASGARGDWTQFSQLVSGAILVNDASNKPVPIPIRRSLGEGLGIADYMTHMHGARKGTLDRASGTSDPGALTKDIMNTAMNLKITAEDCGSTVGLKLPVTAKDLDGRFTVHAVKLPDGTTWPARHLLQPADVKKLQANHVADIEVRSALHCKQTSGVCATCYGHNEFDKLHAVGANIGVIAGHALGEPVTQLAMKCSDGVVWDGSGRAWALEDFFEAHGGPVREALPGVVERDLGAYQRLLDSEGPVRASHAQGHLPDDQMVYLKTEGGRVLVAQANHPLWVYTAGGAERVVAVGEVREGQDYLRVAPPVTEMSGEVLEDPGLPGYLLGFYLAEGCVRRGNGRAAYQDVPVATVISQYDNAYRPRVAELLRSLPDIGTVSVLPEAVEVYDVAFSAKISDLVRGRDSYHKRLCPGFNRWSDDVIRDVLAGWIDGDGTVFVKSNTSVAKLYTSSIVALQQLEILCERLGIRCAQTYVSRPDTRVQVQSRHANFSAELRFYAGSMGAEVWAASSKCSALGPLQPAQQRMRVAAGGLDRVRKVQRMDKWITRVWDVETESAGYICGRLRNHNTFHTGGAASSEEGLMDSFKRAKQLFKVPKVLPGQAVLATLPGKVDAIKEDKELGGHDVVIAGVRHYIPAKRSVKVVVGQEVTPGTPLSGGPANPVDLLRLTKSVPTVRAYMTDELTKAYHGGGGNVKQRNVEVVVRAMTNITRIEDPGDHPGYTRGDYAPLSEVQALNSGNKGGNQIKHTPVIRPMTEVPLIQTEDVFARLNYARLEQTYLEAAAQGWTSDIHGHPIPGLVHGADFGVTHGAAGGHPPATAHPPQPSTPSAKPTPSPAPPVVARPTASGWGGLPAPKALPTPKGRGW